MRWKIRHAFLNITININKSKKKSLKFKVAIGEVFNELCTSSSCISLNKIANEYDIDKGTLSKIERGFYNVQLMTVWKLCEAYGVSFSDFAKNLEEKLGKEFKLIDE